MFLPYFVADKRWAKQPTNDLFSLKDREATEHKLKSVDETNLKSRDTFTML